MHGLGGEHAFAHWWQANELLAVAWQVDVFWRLMQYHTLIF
jgi:hypothetical protein